MSQLDRSPEEHLYERIATILDEARARVERTVNTAMVHAYWLIGREIIEVEQGGKERALAPASIGSTCGGQWDPVRVAWGVGKGS